MKNKESELNLVAGGHPRRHLKSLYYAHSLLYLRINYVDLENLKLKNMSQ